MDMFSAQRRPVAIVLLLAGAIWLAFWPLLQSEFVNYDDTAYVLENPQVLGGLSWANAFWAFSSGYFGNWHPLTWLSHMLDVQLFGLRAGLHHLTSLLFHAVNAVLLFLLLRRMTGATWRSAAVAAFFGLHPLHVESVAWVSERKDVLSSFFFMLTLWAYVRYAEVRGQRSEVRGQGADRFYFLSLAFFALGLMSKAMVVTVPFVLLLLDYWPLGRLEDRGRRSEVSSRGPSHHVSRFTLLVEKIPFFLLTVVATGIAVMLLHQAGATNEGPDEGWPQRLVRTGTSYGQYLAKAAWPANLAMPYPRPGHWPVAPGLIGVGAVLSVSVVAVRFGRRRPYLPVGWFWFLGMLIPVIGLSPVGSQPFADRYTYLPLIGLSIMLVWLLADLGERWRLPRSILFAAVIVALLACAIASHMQAGFWHDSEQLYRRALQVTQNNYLAHNGLGLHLFQKGKVAEAIQHYEAAVQINPLYDVAQSNLGRALAERGRYAEAMQHLETSLKLRPDDIKARNNLGGVLMQSGRTEEAVQAFQEVVRLQPRHASAYNNLALSYEKLGRKAEAVGCYRRALGLQPESLQALNNLAWLLATCPEERIRNGTEAVELATRACELSKYMNPVPVATLAAAYAGVGRFAEAVSFVERAQELIGQGAGQLPKQLAVMLKHFQAGQAYRSE